MTASAKKVGVRPPAAYAARRRLFAALEDAFPVRFEARGENAGAKLDALIQLGGEAETAPDVPPPGLPILMLAGAPPAAIPVNVQFQNAPELDARLRGRELRDERAGGGPPLEPAPGETVLAQFGGAPGWTTRQTETGAIDRVAAPLAKLGPEECLRDRLCSGDFLKLLPLVHWLRLLTVDEDWSPPAPRACFIFDDPNLHGRSFGYVKFAELAAHAERHNYHAAMATVPLDAWLARKGVARIFRENPARLSLLIHGNDHVSGELERPRSGGEAQRLLAQALRRIVKLERRAGVGVDRVMVAPHGCCAEVVMRHLPRMGFEAACISRPYPWLERPPASNPWAQWRPADMVAGGATVIPRYRIGDPRDDVVLRAFLGQPLVIYGHQENLREGLGVLEECAALINSFGAVRWESLEGIARSSCLARREGSLLRVRPLARRLALELPEGVERVRLEKPPWWSDLEGQDVILGNRREPLAAQPEFDVAPARAVSPTTADSAAASMALDVLLPHPIFFDAGSIPDPAPRLWPIARRLLAEGRDRLRPLLRK